MAITAKRFGGGVSGLSVRDVFGDVRRQSSEGQVEHRAMLEYATLIPEANTGPLKLTRFPFQREPFYSDEIADAEEVVYRKATQVGASTGLWRWAVRLVDQFGETVIYFFPTLAHITDFSDERIEPSIQASEYLQSRMPSSGTRRKTLKEIGTGKLLLRGVVSKAAVQSIAGQAVIFDEYDECFVAGTLVLTKSGYRPIESIQVGDEVLTHRGRWRRVEATGSHWEARTHILKAQGIPHLRGSAQHPIYARAYEGKRNFPVAPFRRRTYGKPEWVRLDELGQGKWKVAQGLPPVVHSSRSAEWWWFLGRYLADGCSDGNSVHIEAGLDEAQEVEERLNAVFWNVKRKPYREARAIRFTISSRALCAELTDFGRYSHGKRLTGEALALSREKAKALLDGYLSGDGHCDERGYWSASSVSRELAMGLALLVQRVHGVVAGCCECAKPPSQMPSSAGGRTVNPRTPYRMSFAPTNQEADARDGLLWKALREVQEADGATVYNIAVAEDESFIAEGCVVHNCDPTNIAQAERRISGARAAGFTPRIRRAGRPSIPGYGIDAAFSESDQRHWQVTCEECGEVQVLTFADNLRWESAAAGDKELRAGRDSYETRKDVSRAWRACRRCNASLENGPLLKGAWKAIKPGPGRVPGFHIPRLIVQSTDLIQIVRASRATKIGDIEAFHNADLGEAWAATDARLTDEDLDRASAQGIQEQTRYTGRNPVTLGLDVASERDLSCRISEHLPNGTRRALRIWEPTGYEEVAQAMVDFRVHVAAVDSMPERRAIGRPLQDAFPGRVFLVEYNDDPRSDAWRFDEKRGIVTVNRTEGIDAMMDSIRSATNIPTKPPPPLYYEQMKSMVRRIEEDTKGRPRRVYLSTGSHGDDYAHAEVYDLVASEMLSVLTMTQQEMEAGEPTIIDAPAPVNLGWGSHRYRPGFED